MGRDGYWHDLATGQVKGTESGGGHRRTPGRSGIGVLEQFGERLATQLDLF